MIARCDMPMTRILVVDDEPNIRTMVRSCLEAEGYGVREAANGREALDATARWSPDLVLLDLAMPRMDGLEALPLIRAAVPDVRVVVLSGFNQDTLARKALEAGADHYVVKGGSMRELLDLAESLFAPAS